MRPAEELAAVAPPSRVKTPRWRRSLPQTMAMMTITAAEAGHRGKKWASLPAAQSYKDYRARRAQRALLRPYAVGGRFCSRTRSQDRRIKRVHCIPGNKSLHSENQRPHCQIQRVPHGRIPGFERVPGIQGVVRVPHCGALRKPRWIHRPCSARLCHRRCRIGAGRGFSAASRAKRGLW